MLSLQLSQLLLLTPTLTLMRGTDTTDTVAMDGVVTTGLTATTVITERGPQLLTLPLTLMRGTDTTDTVAMDGVVTTGLTATTDTMERGPLRLSQSQLLPLIPMLMLM